MRMMFLVFLAFLPASVVSLTLGIVVTRPGVVSIFWVVAGGGGSVARPMPTSTTGRGRHGFDRCRHGLDGGRAGGGHSSSDLGGRRTVVWNKQE